MKFHLFDDIPLQLGQFQDPQEALALLFERTIQLEKWQTQLMSMMGLPEEKKEKIIGQFSDVLQDLLYGIQDESQFIFKSLYPDKKYRPHLEQYILTLQQTLEMMNGVYKNAQANSIIS